VGFLRDFEARLEEAVDTLLSRAFRSGVHPVEIARRIVREQEDGRVLGPARAYAPNHFTVYLAPADRERFSTFELALKRELEALVARAAGERGWALLGPAEVVLETEEALRPGRFRVEGKVVEARRAPPAVEAGPGAGPAGEQLREAVEEPTRVVGRVVEEEAPRAYLVVVEGEERGASFPLEGTVTLVGRLPECDVRLRDRGVSRRHLQISRIGPDFVLADLGSTNGTYVNGRRVRTARLAPGDTVRVGRTVLEFRLSRA
jgi:hypothetical protein